MFIELSSLVLWNKSHPFFYFRRLYRTFPTIQMHQLHGQKYFIKHMHNDKLLCIMQLFSQYNIHPYLTEIFQMPSISTMTSLRLCTNPICQQRGFDKQHWRVVQCHELLTHHMHISSINVNNLSCIIHQLNINKCITKQYHEMTIEYLSLFVSWVDSILIMKPSFLIQVIR